MSPSRFVAHVMAILSYQGLVLTESGEAKSFRLYRRPPSDALFEAAEFFYAAAYQETGKSCHTGISARKAF